jgi:hypothetical protein
VTTPEPDNLLTEVPVQAEVLRASAALLELLSGFFTTDPAACASLGTYLTHRRSEDNTTDTSVQAALALEELHDAAELLHALAGDFHPRTTMHQ